MVLASAATALTRPVGEQARCSGVPSPGADLPERRAILSPFGVCRLIRWHAIYR